MPTVRIRVVEDRDRDSDHDPIVGRTVRATHAPDTRCDAGYDFVVGVTNSDGRLTVGLPFGDWRFTVDGETFSGGSWPTWTVDPPYEIKRITLEVD